MAETVKQESGFSFKQMYADLQTALNSTEKPPNVKGVKIDKTFFLRNWAIKYKWALFIAAALIFILFGDSRKVHRDKRRSHHGINKYGERY